MFWWFMEPLLNTALIILASFGVFDLFVIGIFGDDLWDSRVMSIIFTICVIITFIPLALLAILFVLNLFKILIFDAIIPMWSPYF